MNTKDTLSSILNRLDRKANWEEVKVPIPVVDINGDPVERWESSRYSIEISGSNTFHSEGGNAIRAPAQKEVLAVKLIAALLEFLDVEAVCVRTAEPIDTVIVRPRAHVDLSVPEEVRRDD